jgi:putative transposase
MDSVYQQPGDRGNSRKKVTVSRRGDHWSVSIQTERQAVEPIQPSSSSVGVDLGITRFAALSDGSFLEPLNSFKKMEKKHTKEPRRLARKKKLPMEKAATKKNRLPMRIADARNDSLHNASPPIGKNNAVVCIEDVKRRDMSRSASAASMAPGRKVRARSRLNSSLLDRGWFEFRRQLEYKLAWNGGWLICVVPQNTSRTCPACGLIVKKTARYKRGSGSWHAVSGNTPIWLAPCISKGAGPARFAGGVSGAVMPPAAGIHQGNCSEAYAHA